MIQERSVLVWLVWSSIRPSGGTQESLHRFCRRHELRSHIRQWVRLEEKKRLVSRPFVAAAPHLRRRGTEKMKRSKREDIALAAEPASRASCSALRARDEPHERERVELGGMRA